MQPLVYVACVHTPHGTLVARAGSHIFRPIIARMRHKNLWNQGIRPQQCIRRKSFYEWKNFSPTTSSCFAPKKYISLSTLPQSTILFLTLSETLWYNVIIVIDASYFCHAAVVTRTFQSLRSFSRISINVWAWYTTINSWTWPWPDRAVLCWPAKNISTRISNPRTSFQSNLSVWIISSRTSLGNDYICNHWTGN
jgi:hypothetical protein